MWRKKAGRVVRKKVSDIADGTRRSEENEAEAVVVTGADGIRDWNMYSERGSGREREGMENRTPLFVSAA